MILGIDFGSTTTDVVLMENEKSCKKCRNRQNFSSLVKSETKVSNFTNNKKVVKSMSWQSDKFDINTLFIYFPVKEAKQIKVTGCGSLKIKDKLFGIPVKKVDEIKAIGLGGVFVSGKKNALVVSIGSGTCMVSAGSKFKHIGGTSIGGGTLVGLGKLLFDTSDLGKIEKMAEKGSLDNVDLTMRDIYPKGVGILPASATASHFGSVKLPSPEDKALALINMVAQSIATLAVFAAKSCGHKTIVLTGKAVNIKLIDKIIKKRVTSILKLPVIIPKNAEHATAIGAVLG